MINEIINSRIPRAAYMLFNLSEIYRKEIFERFGVKYFGNFYFYV